MTILYFFYTGLGKSSHACSMWWSYEKTNEMSHLRQVARGEMQVALATGDRTDLHDMPCRHRGRQENTQTLRAHVPQRMHTAVVRAVRGDRGREFALSKLPRRGGRSCHRGVGR